MSPLDAPAAHLVQEMESVQITSSTASQLRVPDAWCKRLCKHRDLFSQTILCVASTSQKRFYYFLYASQSPQEVVLAPSMVADLNFEASSGSLCRANSVPCVEHCASFSLSVGSYTSGRGLALADEEYLHVIPHVGFRMGSGDC